MKRISAFCTWTAVAVFALAAPASAQSVDSPYRFLDHSQFGSLWGGYVAASDGTIDNGPESAPIFGASWALRVSGPFAINVEAGYMPTTRVIRDTVFDETESVYEPLGETDFGLLTVMGNLRLNLPGARTWHGLQPFAIVGAGLALDVAGGSEIEAELPANARFDFGTSFAGQLGAGVDWFPTSRVSIRVDARDMFWKLPVPEAFLLTENGARLSRSEWEQNFALAAGLSIHF
ncbi:MAG TPA: outer membrane beta-barrel protein [Longimicrobiales bacterium]|nr:outer membrane beta-barrel protein [Longimicrobiales bacterium]